MLYKNSHLDEGRHPRSQQFYHNKQKYIVVCIRLLLKSFKLELSDQVYDPGHTCIVGCSGRLW